MLHVGITGGIGSGKSTICRIFQVLNIPIYFADDRAKELMIKNDFIKHALIDAFGKDCYFEDGNLNRAYISNIVFKNKEKLDMLNSIVHPVVFADGALWQEQHQHAPYTMKEAALLFETGSYLALDKIITVFAPEHIRLERVMKRDGTSKQDVLDRMSKQMPDKEKMDKADYIIVNDGTQSVLKQVLDIHHDLMTQSSTRAQEKEA